MIGVNNHYALPIADKNTRHTATELCKINFKEKKSSSLKVKKLQATSMIPINIKALSMLSKKTPFC
jgi:hypothetical protein